MMQYICHCLVWFNLFFLILLVCLSFVVVAYLLIVCIVSFGNDLDLVPM